MATILHLLPLLVVLLALVLLVHALFWGMHFRLDDKHVCVVIYGLMARKIALTDIAWADRQWSLWNEHYTSSLNPRRFVRLRRRTGFLRDFLITPPDAPAFLAELAARGIETR